MRCLRAESSRPGLSLSLAALAALSLPAMSAAAEIELLGDQAVWQHTIAYRQPVAGSAKDREVRPVEQDNWNVRGGDYASALPPAGWTEPGFDDSIWAADAAPLLGGYGNSRPAGAALLCLRSRFEVLDARRAAGLKLSLAYRGGVVVYVNGREIARRNMPAGLVRPLTLADDYPPDAFVTPGGEALLPNFGARKPPEELLDRYESRIRRAEVQIPADAIREGRNVVALELHRTAIPPDLPADGRGAWDTVGLLTARLVAPSGAAVAAAAGAATEGAQVWIAPPWDRVESDLRKAGRLGPGAALRLLAPRNGFDTAQVVVAGAAGIRGLAATAGDLSGPGGSRIPASAVRILYAKIDETFIPLFERSIDGATVQPVWVTVKVPPDAAPGSYTGRLELGGLKDPVALPIELTVYGWRLGDPRQWRIAVNVLQSPESVAGYYGVPLWSDEHFRLLEKSLALMGRAGNDVLGISAVGRSVFGDDPLIVFRRQGDRYVPEVKFAERYLRLYDRYAGPPQFLALHVWDYGMYYSGSGRDGGRSESRAEVIPVVELRGEELVPIELPIYGEPGTEETWREVIDGLRGCLGRMGWERTQLLVGTAGDASPSPETAAFFKRIAPDVQWRALTHGGGVPLWGISDHERTQPNGMTVGYLEIARRLVNQRVRQPDRPVTCNARDNVGSDPWTYRGLAMVNTIATGYDGYCWKGIDYWTYDAPDGTKRNALNTYVHFGNMVGGTPRAMAFPGPEGAVTTAQFEMLLRGIEDTEAVLAIRNDLRALLPADAERYDLVTVRLDGALWRDEGTRGKETGQLSDKDLDLALVFRPGDAAPSRILPTARTYNKGRHSADFKVLESGRGLKLDMHVVLGDDNWVPGGEGDFVVECSRQGDSFSGTYRGQYKGKPRQGALTGELTRNVGGPEIAAMYGGASPQPAADGYMDREGIAVALTGVRSGTPLSKRCDQAIGELVRAIEGGRRSGMQGDEDLRQLVDRLYAAAAETAAAAK